MRKIGVFSIAATILLGPGCAAPLPAASLNPLSSIVRVVPDEHDKKQFRAWKTEYYTSNNGAGEEETPVPDQTRRPRQEMRSDPLSKRGLFEVSVLHRYTARVGKLKAF